MDSLFNNLAKKFRINHLIINNFKILQIKLKIKTSIINQKILNKIILILMGIIQIL